MTGFPIKFFLLKLLTFSSVSILLVSGCTGIQTAQDYLLNDNEGLVYFTMTESGRLGERFELTFVNESTNKKIKIAFHKDEKREIGNNKSTQGYLAYDQPRGRLVVLRLPDAVYRLDNWQSDRQAHGRFSLDTTAGKKFKVKTGHALYLGNMHLLSDASKTSLLIRDNRIHDRQLFLKHYPRVVKDKMLVSSKYFLDPAAGRERLFDAYTGCQVAGYEMISKKRLPSSIEKFRTLQVASKERKISRIDGYRLKFRDPEGPVTLSMKIELSDARQYLADKKVLNEWMLDIKQSAKGFTVSSEAKGYFSEYQLVTQVLDEKRMIYMVVMFDDVSQLITNMTFINPPEYLRTYKTVEEFIPRGKKLVNDYQQCVIGKLNKVM